MQECIYCWKPTNSKYSLCVYHYTLQFKRLKKWIIKEITEYKEVRKIKKKQYKKWLLNITMPKDRFKNIIISSK